MRKRSRKEKKAIHAKKHKSTMQHRDDFTVGYGYASDHTKTRKRSRDYGDVF